MMKNTPDTPVERRFARSREFARHQGPRLGAAVAFAALAVMPQAAEHAIEGVEFPDHVATLPVDMRLQHNGTSTFDAGPLGKINIDKTGPFGFGLNAQSTGSPDSDGTLASYVDPAFLRKNADYLGSIDDEVAAYASEASDEFWNGFLEKELAYSAVAGLALWGAVTSRYKNKEAMKPVHWRLSAAAVVGVAALSTASAAWQFNHWSNETPVGHEYTNSDWPGISFSSRATLEVARQIKPGYEKNQERIKEDAANYLLRANQSIDIELLTKLSELQPRPGEKVLFAEADPQGSKVGSEVRSHVYQSLLERFGSDSFIARVVAGDFTSNGTVGESGYVKGEVNAGASIPVVVSLGDHDDDSITKKQLEDNGALVPNFETVEVNGAKIAGASDPEHKTLFGGIIENTSGVSEQEMGEKLRAEAEKDTPDFVVLHQPDAAAGFLGIDSVYDLFSKSSNEIHLPVDLPASVKLLLIGHTHELKEPKIIVRADGSKTIIDQLGTSGGWENRSTIGRFSTPDSAPLKTLSYRMYYVDSDNYPTGYATFMCSTEGDCTITDRVDTDLHPPEVVADNAQNRKSKSEAKANQQ